MVSVFNTGFWIGGDCQIRWMQKNFRRRGKVEASHGV